MMVDVLAKLHRLDPDAVGLGDLGKPQGFLNRAVEGWIKRATLATSDWGRARTDALIVALSRWMRANVGPDQNIELLHNHYNLDNILLSPETLAAVAVAQWATSRRGDGLFSLSGMMAWVAQHDDQQATTGGERCGSTTAPK